MPFDSLLNLEWLNHNANRNYPLADTADGVDQSLSFTLPEEFLVELYIPVHRGLNIAPGRFFIKNLGIFSTGFSIVIGYSPSGGGSAVDVATALIPRQTHTLNQSYALGGVGDFDDVLGKLVIGKLDNIDDQPEGYFTFDFENSRLDPDTIRPQIRGLQALVVRSGDSVSRRIYGDVELVAGTNQRITPIVVSGQDPQIIFDAIEGEGLTEECICEGDVEGPPIRRINDIPPTAAGDFTILGNECLQVSGVANGIRLEDVCSKPCCGCEELERITADLQKFADQETTLSNFLVRLSTSVTQFENVVLGSTLNDQACGC